MEYAATTTPPALAYPAHYTLRSPLVEKSANGHTTQRVAMVKIQQLYHFDRVAAEKEASTSMDVDDVLIHRMTGIPLAAITQLSLFDADNLMEIFMQQAGLDALSPDDEATPVEAGHVHVLSLPLDTPMGKVTELRLRELTRGDQKSAAQWSKFSTEQEAFLIGAMASLQLEDVMNLAIKDSYALRGLFRRVTGAGKEDAGIGQGVDAGAPQSVPCELVTDDVV